MWAVVYRVVGLVVVHSPVTCGCLLPTVVWHE